MILEKTDRDRLISDNMGLVYACANRFKNRGAEYEDLVQCGCIGLVKAADGFDPTLGFRFSTYAVPAILGEIKRVFRDSGSVKVGRTDREKLRELMRLQESMYDELGRPPTVSELAEKFGCEPSRAAQLLSAGMPVLSLTSDDESDEKQNDIACEDESENISDSIALRCEIQQLDERDREILTMRYFNGQTQSAVAQKLGMTQVQVSRREKVILRMLREKLI